jgi:aspartyl-tRNA(Asn)/glutamyl-tRNA(Gln) amidotransferase subunit C
MADQPITKETLAYLANLARIDLTSDEEKRFLGELQNIVHHVAELQGVDTEGVAPMNGGGNLENIFRDDTERIGTNQGEGPDQFPNKENGFLKVPPIFGS